MSVELIKKTCDTMGCRNAATHILTTPGLDPEDENTYTDHVCESCGQGYMRRPALRATLAPMASPKPTPAPQSGYAPCGCRDCMDITMSGNTAQPELCSLCAEAGCEAYEHPVYPGTSYECQRDDAYGE